MDLIKKFIFKELNIKGQHLQLTSSWQKMIAERHYPNCIISLLGELTAITAMLANGLKHEGKITIQIQGTGAVNLLVVEVTNKLQIRGVAKTTTIIDDELDINQLLGDEKILVTLQNDITNKHFQSYVLREKNSIAEAFANFLTKSDQLPSKLWLAADKNSVGAVIIQKMPATDGIDNDGWNRINHLANTVTQKELISLDTEELINLLFNEELVELFAGEEIKYFCPKNNKKIADMLISLGKEECLKIISEQKEIVIYNEMCNYHARYNQQDIDKLFN